MRFPTAARACCSRLRGRPASLREACRAASVEIVLLEDEDAGGDRCWRSLLSDAAATADLPAVAADDAAVLFYTSGTTGAAKGVPLSIATCRSRSAHSPRPGWSDTKDRALLPLPLHHVYPFVVGMLVPLAFGLPLVLPSAFTGSRVLQALQQGRVTVVIGVPRLYDALLSGLDARLDQRSRVLAGHLCRHVRIVRLRPPTLQGALG